MFSASRRPSLSAVVAGACLLVFAGGGVLLGVQSVGTLLTSPSLPLVLLFAGGLSLGVGYQSYRASTRQVLSQLRATSLSDARAPELHAIIDGLAHRMKVDRPDVYLAHMGQPTAVALGKRTIVVDAALVRLLTGPELEGVLAHEFAHLESHDSLLRTVAMSVFRMVATIAFVVFVPFVAVVFLGCWGLSLLLGRPVRGPDSVGYGVRRALSGGVMGLLLAPTLALQAYSRRREYAADQRAVAVIDEPLALARALEKIQRANEPDMGVLSWLFPSRSRERTPLERAFASHPPTDERIARVREAVQNGGAQGRHIPID